MVYTFVFFSNITLENNESGCYNEHESLENGLIPEQAKNATNFKFKEPVDIEFYPFQL